MLYTYIESRHCCCANRIYCWVSNLYKHRKCKLFFRCCCFFSFYFIFQFILFFRQQQNKMFYLPLRRCMEFPILWTENFHFPKTTCEIVNGTHANCQSITERIFHTSCYVVFMSVYIFICVIKSENRNKKRKHC